MKKYILFLVFNYLIVNLLAAQQGSVVTAQTPTLLPLGTSKEMRKTLSPPPQDQGLPYTRSAKSRAIAALQNTITLCSGGRYAYVFGYKVRMDTSDILHGEAFIKDGKIYVPQSFASVLTVKNFQPKPVPNGLDILKERWVYDIERQPMTVPPSVSQVEIKGEKYFSAVDFVKSQGRQVLQTPRGILIISDKKINYNESADAVLADCVVSLFDTPEKYIDPDIPMRYVPTLKRQGGVKDHARITPEQWQQLNEPESEWQEPPRSSYDLTGFNAALLGSKVPKVGVYPRLLFSPDDLPMLQRQVKSQKSTQKSFIEIETLFKKTWWDSTTSDGKIFNLLAAGGIGAEATVNGQGAAAYHVAALTKEHKPGIYNSHVNYVTNCLTTMAFYCLLTNNDVLGKKVANAVVNYYKIVETKVEEHLRKSDSEFGITPDESANSETQWRGMHGILPHMDMAFSLDFAGKYMSPDQLKFMQNLIAKATYGRRTNAGDGPRRAWRDINHMTWHLTHHICLAAIEGLDGFDTEGYASGCELTRDFLNWGIDEKGHMFESNGKSGGGIQFQILAMIVQARRGDNLWGHPHWRKMLTSQVYMTSPDGRETVTSGTWGGTQFSFQAISEIKAFYPQNKAADYLLTQQFPDINWASFDTSAYRRQLEKNIKNVRLPATTYPAFVLGFPYCSDWEPIKRADLDLPTDFNTNTYGFLSTSSNQKADATWLALHVRNNHYIGSGHHHADIGMFYFSGLGVNWFTESPFSPKAYAGKYHNLLLIDGKAEAENPPAAGKYLGAKMGKNATFGTVDLTYAYTWQWCTQVLEWGTGFSKIDSTVATKGWELEPNPDIIKYFKGTQRYKMRVWWPSSNYANWIPTLRALWNPVQYVYRSTGLVKGEHSYGIIVDDAKKDDKEHLYQWSAMTAKGVWKVNYKSLPQGATVLGYRKELEKIWMKPTEQSALEPQQGEPLLLVYDLEKNTPSVHVATDGFYEPPITTRFGDGKMSEKDVAESQNIQPYNRLTLDRKDKAARYKVLLIPFYYGDDLPKITYAQGKATVEWKNQVDIIDFEVKNDFRTKVKVCRNNVVIGENE